MSNKLFSKWFDKQPKETQNLVNDYIANKIKKVREEEREKISNLILERLEIKKAKYINNVIVKDIQTIKNDY